MAWALVLDLIGLGYPNVHLCGVEYVDVDTTDYVRVRTIKEGADDKVMVRY
jgi:hypothetical protein